MQPLVLDHPQCREQFGRPDLCDEPLADLGVYEVLENPTRLVECHLGKLARLHPQPLLGNRLEGVGLNDAVGLLLRGGVSAADQELLSIVTPVFQGYFRGFSAWSGRRRRVAEGGGRSDGARGRKLS
jgi:hypothetical protein